MFDEPDDPSTKSLPTLSWLVYRAGLFGSRVLLSFITLTPGMAVGPCDAHCDGRRIWSEH